MGDLGEFRQWDLQDSKLEGLSMLRSRWLASVPGEDSELLPGLGLGKVESCQALEEEARYRKLGQGGYLVGRLKCLRWRLQGGLGLS